jgi:hypothetical protein
VENAVTAHRLSPHAYNTSARHELRLKNRHYDKHELISLTALAVCEKQDGLCMDVEEERVRLARAIAAAIAD